MGKLKIYLDNCCYNRPFDEQNQDLIRLETEAKLVIQNKIKQGVYLLVWSFMLILKMTKIFLRTFSEVYKLAADREKERAN